LHAAAAAPKIIIDPYGTLTLDVDLFCYAVSMPRG
jgi:hypothetical protein